MTGLLKSIFYPHDGSRKQIREEVASSRQNVEKAVNRFEETIQGLMDRNDELTGRANALRFSPRE